jgi:hypothetical protein
MNATQFTFTETAEDFLSIAEEMNEFEDMLNAQAIENEENDIARAEWMAMAV